MSNKQFYSIQRSFQIISVIPLFLLYAMFPSHRVLMFEMCWPVYLVIFGNIRRLSSASKIQYFIRMTMYFLPFLLPTIIYNDVFKYIKCSLEYIGLSLVIFFCWIFLNRKSLKLMFSNEVIAYCQQQDKYTLTLMCYNLIGAAIAEELFFRQFILTLSLPTLHKIFFSITYFFLNHWLLPWSHNFSKKDYITQSVVASINVLLFLVSNSISPCIILHGLINSVQIAHIVKQYDRAYCNKEKYDKLLEMNKNLPELDI